MSIIQSENKEYQKYKKKLNHFEWRIDALSKYLTSIQPNYSFVNYSSTAEDYKLTNDVIAIDPKTYYTSDTWNAGKIIITNNSNMVAGVIYLLKQFNHKEIIWISEQNTFINTTWTAAELQSYLSNKSSNFLYDWLVNKEDQVLTGNLEPVAGNTWVIIDKTKEEGYFKTPASVGSGDAYLFNWKRVGEKDYKIYGTITSQKAVSDSEKVFDFFMSPLQTRYRYSDIGESGFFWIPPTTKELIIDFQGIKNSHNHYYQPHQLVMSEYVLLDRVGPNTQVYRPIVVPFSESLSRRVGGYRSYNYTISIFDQKTMFSSDNLLIGGYFW